MVVVFLGDQTEFLKTSPCAIDILDFWMMLASSLNQIGCRSKKNASKYSSDVSKKVFKIYHCMFLGSYSVFAQIV